MRQRRDDLQRANRGLETTTELGRALGGMTDLDRVLELVVKRSRALIDARAAELALLDGEQFVIAAVAGDDVTELAGRRLAPEESIAAAALRSGRSQRFRKVPEGTVARDLIGARTALVTPMIFRNRAVGFLSVFDRLDGDGTFSQEDERLLQAFAASAATAVATAQTAGHEALQRSLRASEQERQKWARELHDETLQELAGLKILLASARRSADPARLDAAVDEAIAMITDGIANLRALITDLRPAALDDLGTVPALKALAARVEAQTGLPIELELGPAREQDHTGRRHEPELEAAVYRLVQEALTNAVKHASASRVLVSVIESEGDECLDVEIRDDGRASIRKAHTKASACSGCTSASRLRACASRCARGRARGRRSALASQCRGGIPRRSPVRRADNSPRPQQRRQEGRSAVLLDPCVGPRARSTGRVARIVVDPHDDQPQVGGVVVREHHPEQPVVHDQNVGTLREQRPAQGVTVHGLTEQLHAGDRAQQPGEGATAETLTIDEQYPCGLTLRIMHLRQGGPATAVRIGARAQDRSGELRSSTRRWAAIRCVHGAGTVIFRDHRSGRHRWRRPADHVMSLLNEHSATRHRPPRPRRGR